MKFGRLLVLCKLGKKWLCKCDCGTYKLIATGNFKHTKSCGCIKKEMMKQMCLEKKIWQFSSVANKKLMYV
jgi:hypothetical protein